MVKQSLLFLLLTLFISSSWAVKFESSVDRRQIGEGESVLLTVRYNSNTLTGNPDFSPLRQQFEIINQQRKSSFQFINGQSESWTVWTVALIPKRIGNLIIPSLNFNGESTQIIQIQVNKVSDSIKNKQKEVFFHTEIDVKTAYVQGQILYSEKLYFSLPLENGNYPSLNIDGALVDTLGETAHYNTKINGIDYGVFERKYVIFPQVSGEMVIPGPRYTGEINNGRWRAGSPIRISNPPIKMNVLPQPASYPPQQTWLPAQHLSLDYEWSGNPNKIKLGEPISLKIQLKARGLSSAQLPSITLPEVDGLKYYPDQPTTEDRATEQGITGLRSQSIAIVPTRSGSLTLPELRIPWWNSVDAKLEYAVIPALRISALSNGSKSTPPPKNADEPLQVSTIGTPIDTEDAKAISLLWPLVAALFLLLWLLTLYLWWAKKPEKDVQANENAYEKKSNASLKSIKLACRANDPKMARAALLSWAQAKWQISTNSLGDISKRIEGEGLHQALQQLDNHLYSPTDNTDWQGEPLWQIIKSHKEKASKSAPLTSLYPNESTRIKAQHG